MIELGSKSYPFLGIARHYEMEYGAVLAYASAVRKIVRRLNGESVGFVLDVWEQSAARSIDIVTREAIERAVIETMRQKGERT